MQNRDTQEENAYGSKRRVYLGPLCSFCYLNPAPQPRWQRDVTESVALCQAPTYQAIENWSAFNSNL